jgi:hypothetical protein
LSGIGLVTGGLLRFSVVEDEKRLGRDRDR